MRNIHRFAYTGVGTMLQGFRGFVTGKAARAENNGNIFILFP
jgi:hypothetical protein